MFNSIIDEINKNNNVVLTTHKNIDIDGLSAMLGVYNYCQSIEKDIYMVVEDELYDSTIYKAMDGLDAHFSQYEEIKNIINQETLLIIVDTNNETLIQNKELSSIKNKVIIDHHTKTNNNYKYIISYIDDEFSSAAEIVFRNLDDLKFIFDKKILTIMLAGILIDTNNLSIKTTYKTYYSCYLLLKRGADNSIAHDIIKEGIYEYQQISKAIKKMVIYNQRTGVVCLNNNIVSKSMLAKIADMMIGFENIKEAFAIGYIEEKIVGISARSNVSDVANIMKKFGGGGHKNNAAAQIEKTDITTIKEKLLELIGGLR